MLRAPGLTAVIPGMEINVQVSDVDLTTVINPDSEDGIRPWTIADAVAYQLVERLRSDQELYPALKASFARLASSGGTNG